jgi:hypothetical protein
MNNTEVIKKSNMKISQSLLIFIHTNKTAVECKDEVVEWFLKCITPLAELQCKGDNGQCDLKIISTIKDNDYVDVNGDGDIIHNTIIIALQNGQIHDLMDNLHDEDDIIILDENPISNNLLKADDILHYLDNEPKCITKYGVSGVSTKCMKLYWGEMIDKESSCFDIPGDGFMIHRMWLYDINAGWNDIREMSYDFGWKNYNPRKVA